MKSEMMPMIIVAGLISPMFQKIEIQVSTTEPVESKQMRDKKAIKYS